jgi:hypothetical protein
MNETNGSATTPVESANSLYRPEDVQEMFGIKQRAYYNRLKYLGIEANKDEQGKPYLDAEQVELLKAFHEHINETGKMEGFPNSQNGGLVKADRNGLGHSNNGKISQENIYVEPEEPVDNSEVTLLLREAEELRAREIAMRDLIKRKLADQMSEEDLPPDLQEKVRLAREAANPKFTPQEVAATLLQQWREKRVRS